MTTPARWARTQDQVDLLRAARTRGGLCSACGRQLELGETVYFDRFGVGTVRPRPLAPVRPRSYNFAPVGAECASPELLQHGQAQDAEPCAGCGRGVVHPGAKRTRKRASCSLWCGSRASAAAHPKPAGVTRPVSEPWGKRLQRYREARGMSRAELALACQTLERRTDLSEIATYEESGDYPRVPTFGVLARVLGVSMEVLLYGEEEAERLAEERTQTLV
jgi:ribosome-binding protein aMBF1 (putative translation factor)